VLGLLWRGWGDRELTGAALPGLTGGAVFFMFLPLSLALSHRGAREFEFRCLMSAPGYLVDFSSMLQPGQEKKSPRPSPLLPPPIKGGELDTLSFWERDRERVGRGLGRGG